VGGESAETGGGGGGVGGRGGEAKGSPKGVHGGCSAKCRSERVRETVTKAGGRAVNEPSSSELIASSLSLLRCIAK
jgi:hypothetical protein